MSKSLNTDQTNHISSDVAKSQKEKEDVIFLLSNTLVISHVSEHSKCMEIICSYLMEDEIFKVFSRLNQSMQELIMGLFETQEKVCRINMADPNINLREFKYVLKVYPDIDLIFSTPGKDVMKMIQSFLQTGQKRPEKLHKSKISVLDQAKSLDYGELQTIFNETPFNKEMQILDFELTDQNEDLFKVLMKNICFQEVKIEYENQIEFDGFQKEMNTQCIKSLKLEKFKQCVTYMNWQFNHLPNLQHIQLGLRDLRQISKVDFTKFKHLKKIGLEFMQNIHINHLHEMLKSFLDQVPKLNLDELQIQQTYMGIIQQYEPANMVDIPEILQAFSKLGVREIVVSVNLGCFSKVKLPSFWIDKLGSTQPQYYLPHQVFKKDLLDKFRLFHDQKEKTQKHVGEFLSKPFKLDNQDFHMTNLQRKEDFDALMSFGYMTGESSSSNVISIMVKCPLQIQSQTIRESINGEVVRDAPHQTNPTRPQLVAAAAGTHPLRQGIHRLSGHQHPHQIPRPHHQHQSHQHFHNHQHGNQHQLNQQHRQHQTHQHQRLQIIEEEKERIVDRDEVTEELGQTAQEEEKERQEVQYRKTELDSQNQIPEIQNTQSQTINSSRKTKPQTEPIIEQTKSTDIKQQRTPFAPLQVQQNQINQTQKQNPVDQKDEVIGRGKHSSDSKSGKTISLKNQENENHKQ